MLDVSKAPGTYIKFLDITDAFHQPRKTRVIRVDVKEGDCVLGHIEWHRTWRRYAFSPYDSTVFEARCLGEIAHVLSLLMEDRAKQRAVQALENLKRRVS